MIIFIIMLILLELIAIFLQELYFFSLRVNASLTGQIFVNSPFKRVFFLHQMIVYLRYTTQKGAAIKKIFELRAENRTECSLGW